MVTPRWRATLVVFAAIATSLWSHAQVLIIHAVPNPNYATDVQNKLTASGLITGGITLFDASSNAAPTLSQLQQYKAVLVFSDSTFTDPTALGDALAAYVDAGGGVVQATFTNFSSWALSGRWESENYNPATLGSYASVISTLGTVHVANHPIMAGVNSLDSGGTYYSNSNSLRSGALLISSWSNGAPLAVVNVDRGQRVALLNLYPPSSDAISGSWLSSTDGARLIANTLNFVAVPEPSTYALLALGLALLVWRRRRD